MDGIFSKYLIFWFGSKGVEFFQVFFVVLALLEWKGGSFLKCLVSVVEQGSKSFLSVVGFSLLGGLDIF